MKIKLEKRKMGRRNKNKQKMWKFLYKVMEKKRKPLKMRV
jgi:hypothetical protein